MLRGSQPPLSWPSGTYRRGPADPPPPSQEGNGSSSAGRARDAGCLALRRQVMLPDGPAQGGQTPGTKRSPPPSREMCAAHQWGFPSRAPPTADSHALGCSSPGPGLRPLMNCSDVNEMPSGSSPCSAGLTCCPPAAWSDAGRSPHQPQLSRCLPVTLAAHLCARLTVCHPPCSLRLVGQRAFVFTLHAQAMRGVGIC